MKTTLIINTITVSLFKGLLMLLVPICLCVSTGFPGSMHDALVLRLSNIWSLAEDNRILTMPCMDINGTQILPLILGDSAYPLKSWLMHPFQDDGALTAAHRHFNKELSKARIVVEHGFGQTKARWSCMDKRIDEDMMKIPYITLLRVVSPQHLYFVELWLWRACFK